MNSFTWSDKQMLDDSSLPIVNRRRILQSSALGFGSLALATLLHQQSKGLSDEPAKPVQSLATRVPHFPPRAKRIVFLFMKGGPSHVDTFDPKPSLDRYDGQAPPFALPDITFAKQGNLLRSPWKFRKYGQSGLPVSELFPNVAKHVDDLCIIRSLHGSNPAHGGALLKLHTGSDQFVRPSMGSWISYGLGTENENLPAFITICPTLAHGGVNNWGSAFLPAFCQGTPIGNASLSAKKAQIKHITNSRVPLDLQRKQLEFLGKLNREQQGSSQQDTAMDTRFQSFELAFRMQSSMPEIQDLSQETAATHRLYGVDDPVTENFGRQCLMARRFLEAGVRFVQVTHSDSDVQWDQHGNLYQGHTKNASEVDKPIAGFLQDLKQRGMLDDTLVLWVVNSVGLLRPKGPMDEITILMDSPCGWQVPESKPVLLTGPPMNSATMQPKTRCIFMTFMRRSSICWAWTMND